MKVNQKNIRYGIDNHHHGLFIKEARLRQGYRLTEVAKEICDVSYLSKIESGQLFPNLEIFEKIVEKLEIEFPTETQICPLGVFRNALYQNNTEIIKPYLKNNILHHYEILLLQFFCVVAEGKITKAEELKKKIDQIKSHFNDKEEQAYLLFSGLFYFKNFNWSEGINCLEKSFDYTQILGEEDPYLCLELAKHYFQIQKNYLGFSYLKRATTEFKRIFERSWVLKCDILWCKESLEKGNIRDVEKKLLEWQKLLELSNDIPYRSSIYNVLAIVFEKQGHYLQAEDYYVKSVENRGVEVKEEYIIDLIKFHYRRQNNEQLVKLTQRLDLLRLSVSNRVLIDFYYLKITDSKSEYFEVFLKKDAIPLAMKSLDSQNVEIYSKELINFYLEKMSYKKAVDVYLQLENFRNRLSL